MNNSLQILKAIQETPKDGTLYLVETFTSEAGLFIMNGNLLYVVLNTEKCEPLNISTEYLSLNTNVHISAFDPSVASLASGKYNSLELIMKEDQINQNNLDAFVNLCSAHATHMHGQDFVHFFDSLVELFQLPQEQNYKNLVGLYGELAFLSYTYKMYNLDISPYWHTTGITSKYDYVLPKANLEIKTSSNCNLMFDIKHEQLFSHADKNFLVAVSIEEDNSGSTLNELINHLLSSGDYCNGIQFALNIEKEKRRISPIDSQSKRFLLKKVRLYAAQTINPFVNLPDYINNLTYQINLLPFEETSLATLFDV